MVFKKGDMVDILVGGVVYMGQINEAFYYDGSIHYWVDYTGYMGQDCSPFTEDDLCKWNSISKVRDCVCGGWAVDCSRHAPYCEKHRTRNVFKKYSG